MELTVWNPPWELVVGEIDHVDGTLSAVRRSAEVPRRRFESFSELRAERRKRIAG
jgi:hypothetical protein